MAIIGPSDLPVVLKVDSDPMKSYVVRKLGHPVVNVELTEDQLETAIRNTGDFIAGYFPREQRLATFYTEPLRSTYPLPTDAYWVQEVAWDPSTTRVGDIFGAEMYLFNIGQVTGTNQMLTDLHLLQHYRKFSSKILATYGTWEVINETNGDATQQLIRLYPTPKGVFPVVVMYMPVVNYFRSPQAKYLANCMLLAEAKEMLGYARRRISNFPSPSGGTIQLDGAELIAEAKEEKKELIEKAIKHGEPMPIVMW